MKKILLFTLTALVLAISLQTVSAYSYYYQPDVDTYFKQTVYYPGGKTTEIVKETPWKSSYYRSSEDYRYNHYSYPYSNRLYDYWEYGPRYSYTGYRDYYGYRGGYFDYRPSRNYFHY